MTVDDERLGTEALAQALGKAPYTIRKWAREGTIPFVKTPKGDYRFDLAAVREALEITDLALFGTRLLNVRQLADALKRQPETIRRWARQGVVPAFKEDHEYRFDPIEVRTALVAKPWLTRGKHDIDLRLS